MRHSFFIVELYLMWTGTCTLQGIIINGCVRDIEDLGKIPVGVKALNTCPVKPGKAPVGTKGEPVTFAGITIHTGDWVYADAGMVSQRCTFSKKSLLPSLSVK